MSHNDLQWQLNFNIWAATSEKASASSKSEFQLIYFINSLSALTLHLN